LIKNSWKDLYKGSMELKKPQRILKKN